MSAERPTVDVLLKTPTPSYHRFFEYAKVVGRKETREGRDWSIELLTELRRRYRHVLVIGQELVLQLIEAGREPDAQAELAELDREFGNLDEETQSRWGRIFKDQGDAHVELPWSAPAGGKANPQMASTYYRKSLDRYRQAYGIRSGYYPGINMATLLLILGTLEPPPPGAKPREVLESEALAQALLDSRPDWPATQKEDESLWHPATAGEAFLLRRQLEPAESQYLIALDSPFLSPFSRKSMYRQVERIRLCFHNLGIAIPPPLGDPQTFFLRPPDDPAANPP